MIRFKQLIKKFHNSYFSPLAYLKTNVEGTYNVLKSAKNLNLT